MRGRLQICWQLLARSHVAAAKREHRRVLARRWCLQEGGADRDRKLGAVAADPAERAGVQAAVKVLGGRQQLTGIGAWPAADCRRRVQSRLAIITHLVRRSSTAVAPAAHLNHDRELTTLLRSVGTAYGAASAQASHWSVSVAGLKHVST